MTDTGRNNSIAFKVSLCGVITALGVSIMLLGGMLGVMTYAAPLIASAFLIPVIYEFRNGCALLVYAASSILAVLLCPEKELAFFYVFIGYYPIIRPYFYSIKNKYLRIAAKLALFASAILLMYALLYFVLKLDQLLEELADAGKIMNAVMFAVLILTMLVYDFVLVTAERVYINKLRPRLRFLNRK